MITLTNATPNIDEPGNIGIRITSDRKQNIEKTTITTPTHRTEITFSTSENRDHQPTSTYLQVIAHLQKAKETYRIVNTGGCRMYSQGYACTCILCQIDNIMHEITKRL